MKYLVLWRNQLSGEQGAFYTRFFEASKFDPNLEMVIVDTIKHLVSFDGEMWQDIEKNSL